MELCWKAVPQVDIRVLQISEQLVNMLFMLLQNPVDVFSRHKGKEDGKSQKWNGWARKNTTLEFLFGGASHR